MIRPSTPAGSCGRVAEDGGGSGVWSLESGVRGTGHISDEMSDDG